MAFVAQGGLSEELLSELGRELGGRMKMYTQSIDLTIYSILIYGSLRGPPSSEALLRAFWNPWFGPGSQKWGRITPYYRWDELLTEVVLTMWP